MPVGLQGLQLLFEWTPVVERAQLLHQYFPALVGQRDVTLVRRNYVKQAGSQVRAVQFGHQTGLFERPRLFGQEPLQFRVVRLSQQQPGHEPGPLAGASGPPGQLTGDAAGNLALPVDETGDGLPDLDDRGPAPDATAGDDHGSEGFVNEGVVHLVYDHRFQLSLNQLVADGLEVVPEKSNPNSRIAP